MKTNDILKPIIIAFIIASFTVVAKTIYEQKVIEQKVEFYSMQLNEIKQDVKEIKRRIFERRYD